MNKLLILYGEQNAGKTTTLRKLFEILTGYHLKSRDPKKDFRVVFSLGNKNVFMSTFGDSKNVINTNFSFFQQTPHGKTQIYEYIQEEGKLKVMDKQRLKAVTPDICISACRIYKDGTPNDVYDELNARIMDCMPIENRIQWVAKRQSSGTREKRKTVNSDYSTALSLATYIF
jgi:hypothetical protein